MGCLPATQKVTEQIAVRLETVCAAHPSMALPWSEKVTVPVGGGGVGVVVGTESVAVIVVDCPALTCLATRSATDVCVEPVAAVAGGPAA
jgi:lipid-binding SYLF domain-containing protein